MLPNALRYFLRRSFFVLPEWSGHKQQRVPQRPHHHLHTQQKALVLPAVQNGVRIRMVQVDGVLLPPPPVPPMTKQVVVHRAVNGANINLALVGGAQLELQQAVPLTMNQHVHQKGVPGVNLAHRVLLRLQLHPVGAQTQERNVPPMTNQAVKRKGVSGVKINQEEQAGV